VETYCVADVFRSFDACAADAVDTRRRDNNSRVSWLGDGKNSSR
jgi:hypothetical protein